MANIKINPAASVDLTKTAKLAAMEETEVLKTDVAILKEKVSSLEKQLENKKTWFRFNISTTISLIALLFAIATYFFK